MTTESLCSIGQQQQQQQEQEQAKKQQTIEASTKVSRPASLEEADKIGEERRRQASAIEVAAAAIEVAPTAAAAAANKRRESHRRAAGERHRPVLSTPLVSGRHQSSSVSIGDLGDARKSSGSSNLEQHLCQEEGPRSSLKKEQGSRQQSLVVDSTSILGNKQRIKRFWEQRIAMDFKMRQQQQQQQQQRQQQGSNDERSPAELDDSAAKRMSNGQAQEQPQQQQLLDENNNGPVDGVASNWTAAATSPAPDELQEQPAVNNSDDLRSLSPALVAEPDRKSAIVSDAINGSSTGAAVRWDVWSGENSYGLFDFQRRSHQNQDPQWPAESVSNGVGNADNARRPAAAAAVESVPNTPASSVATTVVKVAAPADAAAVASADANRPNDDVVVHDATKSTISIHTTLCRSSKKASKAAKAPVCQQLSPSTCRTPIAAARAFEELSEIRKGGEFSDSSSSSADSSFGPMSISVGPYMRVNEQGSGETNHRRRNIGPRSFEDESFHMEQIRRQIEWQQDDFYEMEEEGDDDGDDENEDNANNKIVRDDDTDIDTNTSTDTDTDDEPSSAQSGSVSTVITMGQSVKQSLAQQPGSGGGAAELNTRDTNGDNEPTNGDDGGGGSGNPTLVVDNGHSSTTTAAPTEAPNLEEDAGDQPEDLDDEEHGSEGSSNIGVAFESLQFDDEIKSSKNELVDERLMKPAPVGLVPKSKFATDKSVKSVWSGSSADTVSTSGDKRQVAQDSLNDDDDDKDIGPEVKPSSSPILNEPPQSSSTTQRVSFAREHQVIKSNSEGQLTETTGNEGSEEQSSDGDSTTTNEEHPMQRADLSNIFKANVRREIERFEGNSMAPARTPKLATNGGTGGAGNNGGLTEWRIAEEIKLFKEREQELKERLLAAKAKACSQQVAAAASPATQHEIESVVRFGKTIQLPRAAKNANYIGRSFGSSVDLSPPPRATAATITTSGQKSIRLSSSVTPNLRKFVRPSIGINMHKFITSRGERLMFHATRQSRGSIKSQGDLEFSRSMSNLSNVGDGDGKPTPKAADFKAVDSLKCKETPNVKPGSTRKAIEAFSRLNSGGSSGSTASVSSSSSLSSSSPSSVRDNQQQSAPNSKAFAAAAAAVASGLSIAAGTAAPNSTITTARQPLQQPKQQQQQQQRGSPAASAPSACESKVQEEPAKGARAEEAELRDTRRGHVAAAAAALAAAFAKPPPLPPTATSEHTCGGLQVDSTRRRSSDATATPSRDANEATSVTNMPTTDESGADKSAAVAATASRFGFSSKEPLYPIKQAIESFARKQSNSAQAPNNSQVPLKQQQQQQQQLQQNGAGAAAAAASLLPRPITDTSCSARRELPLASISEKNEQEQATGAEKSDNCDDYDSRVGGQRRKASMIEQWESKRWESSSSQ